MAEANDASARWATSIIASLFLHAGVVALFAAPGCEGPSPSEGDEPETPSVAQSESEPEKAPDESMPPLVPVAAEPVRPVEGASQATSAAAPAASAQAAGRAPAPRPAPARPAVARVQPTSPDDAARELPEFHVVRQGDTLTKIAREYGTTPEELAKANGKPLRKMNLLWVGQKIKLRK